MRRPRLIFAKDGRLTDMNDDLITPGGARMPRFARTLALPQLWDETGQSEPQFLPVLPESPTGRSSRRATSGSAARTLKHFEPGRLRAAGFYPVANARTFATEFHPLLTRYL